MFLVRFENRTSSTRSSSGNGAGIGESMRKGTILKGMPPKLKSSKYILVYRFSLGTFWYPLVFVLFFSSLASRISQRNRFFIKWDKNFC